MFSSIAVMYQHCTVAAELVCPLDNLALVQLLFL